MAHQSQYEINIYINKAVIWNMYFNQLARNYRQDDTQGRGNLHIAAHLIDV